jgi:hypothetical protein
MATLQERLSALITALGNDHKAIKSEFLADAAPRSRGFKGWAYDPVSIATGFTIQLLAGRADVAWVHVPEGEVVTKIHGIIITGGSGLTTSGLALFDSSGNHLKTATLAASKYQTAGQMEATLDSSLTVTATGLNSGFYVAFWAVGTTMPTFGRSGNNQAAVNAGSSGAKTRFGRTAASTFTGTTPPSSITVPVPQSATSIWAAAE